LYSFGVIAPKYSSHGEWFGYLVERLGQRDRMFERQQVRLKPDTTSAVS
jgi:hypothetical protein